MFHLKTHQNTIDISWKMMWCQKSWNFLDFLLIVFWYGLSSKLGYPRIHWFTRPCFWYFLLAINWLFTPIPGQSHLILLAIFLVIYPIYPYILYRSVYTIKRTFFSVSDIYVSSVFIVFILFVHWSNQHRPTNLWNNLRWSSFQTLVTANSFQSS